MQWKKFWQLFFQPLSPRSEASSFPINSTIAIGWLTRKILEYCGNVFEFPFSLHLPYSPSLQCLSYSLICNSLSYRSISDAISTPKLASMTLRWSSSMSALDSTCNWRCRRLWPPSTSRPNIWTRKRKDSLRAPTRSKRKSESSWRESGNCLTLKPRRGKSSETFGLDYWELRKMRDVVRSLLAIVAGNNQTIQKS